LDGADERGVDVVSSVEPKCPCGDVYFFEEDDSAVMLSVGCHGDEMQSDCEQTGGSAGCVRSEAYGKSADGCSA